MKNLFGCLLVLALMLAAGVALTWVFFIKPLSGMAEDFSSVVAEFRAVDELNDDIRNTSAFEAPKDGLLSEEQVARFAAVAESIEAAASADITAMRSKYQELGEQSNSPLASLRPRLALEALNDLADTLRAAKLAQVTAMNAHRFSQEEYAWVRTEFYRAGGMAILPVDISAVRNLDFSDISNLDDLRNLPGLGGNTGKIETPDEAAPSDNAALVEPYSENLDEWAQFAVFGL